MELVSPREEHGTRTYIKGASVAFCTFAWVKYVHMYNIYIYIMPQSFQTSGALIQTRSSRHKKHKM